MHGKFPAIQQNQRNSILFHETIPLMVMYTMFFLLANTIWQSQNSTKFDIEQETGLLVYKYSANEA
jgi:hypothetical protein